MSKLIIFTAPSGAGKTTIVRHLLQKFSEEMAFSVSATTRVRRSYEEEGKDYYFMSVPAFQQLIAEGAFAEWVEVYEEQYYGTLKREIARIWLSGKHILFDIDVKGALALKEQYPQEALTIFIEPPSKEVLFDRLRKRQTESEESLQRRFARVSEELAYANKFDIILVNNVLAEALENAEKIVSNYLSSTNA